MRRATRNPFFWLLLVVIALVFVGPIVYMLLTSLKTNVDAQTAPPSLLPREWTLQAFTTLFNDPGAPVLSWLLNSFLIASIFAVVSVLICAMAGYAVARMKFAGRNAIFGLIISTMFIPGFVFLMPNFELLSKLGWLDSYQALILPGAASAFGLFFMRQFFLSLPYELEESARLDGAGAFRTFFSIMLPNARPAVVTLLVLQFLANWNDFLWPLYVLFSEDMLTLPVGLSRLQGSYTIDYPVIMAGASLAAVPVLILFIFVQRYVIQGVAASGLKG
ncbi:carbohydrate ABC transporter permease [Tessaracoccus sp. SD287]|uniref:carbohydrate ABC transporter permease n=1 Tax=Tessaracoccus sp. SD287 TaxID=2782008 RepID=UPI001A96B0A9|nr:carbohydrate ABC transporter permease [Tessaracoccus sp. SD287]MBO1031946.1 carbohydrate ABC transporter permease [Tessaracoccus sp. SD287]